MDNYEKGLSFENRLAQLFRSQGYDVSHNVLLKGRSGVEHQIDLLLQYSSPLHIAKVLVEAKSYSTAIDKDIVMKLIQIVSDVGADRGILVTTSHFTPSAVSTADGFNIDLWDREKLRDTIGEVELRWLEAPTPRSETGPPLSNSYVQARYALDAVLVDLQASVDKRARGFLGIGRVVESLRNVSLQYVPYYEVELSLHLQETRRVGLLAKETIDKTVSTRATFDAVSGIPIQVTDAGIDYGFSWVGDVTRDELTVLNFVCGRDSQPSSLSSLGLAEGRIRRIVTSLEGKGCVQRLASRPVTYRALRNPPQSPLELASITDSLPSWGSASEGSVLRTHTVGHAAIASTATHLWPSAEVISMSTVYYPFFLAIYAKGDGSVRHEAIDGITILNNPYVARTIRFEA